MSGCGGHRLLLHLSHDCMLLPPLTRTQVFDVASFDMIAMLRLPWVPGTAEWCFQVRQIAAAARLASGGGRY